MSLVRLVRPTAITTRGFSVPRCLHRPDAFRSSSTSTRNVAPATQLGAANEDAYRLHSIQDLMSLKGRVTVVTGTFSSNALELPITDRSVTGGARGIGLALARGAAELGSDVAVLDVLDKPSEAFFEFEKDLGVKAGYYRCVNCIETFDNC